MFSRYPSRATETPATGPFDVIIKGGTVYNGNGGEPKPVDVLQPNEREKHLKHLTRVELKYERKCSATLS
jgi:hypothetical protein